MKRTLEQMQTPEIFLTVDSNTLSDSEKITERVTLEKDLMTMGINWYNWELEQDNKSFYVYAINKKYSPLLKTMSASYPSMKFFPKHPSQLELRNTRGRYNSFTKPSFLNALSI